MSQKLEYFFILQSNNHWNLLKIMRKTIYIIQAFDNIDLFFFNATFKQILSSLKYYSGKERSNILE